MMKWLRAHSKQIMVILVLVAMFSFVGGSALVSFLAPNPAKEVVARAFGQDITAGELGFSRRDIEVLESLFQVPPQYAAQFGQVWQLGRPDLKIVDWYLLARESEASGIVVSDQEVDEQLRQLPPETLNAMRTQLRINPSEVRQALRRQMGVQKSVSRMMSAATPSESQVRHYVLDTEEKIKMRIAAIWAQRFVDANETLSEEEVLAHFESHKDLDPADSPDGFGYRYPPRVRLQYLVAHVGENAAQVNISLDAVKSFWKTNKARYTKTIYVDPEPTSAPDSQPADSQPAEPPAPQPKVVEKSFSEARPEIERELARKSAQQTIDQALKKVISHLSKPWFEATTDPETGYKPIPKGADDAEAMRRASEQVSAEFGVRIKYGETGLMTESGLLGHADLRGAYLFGAGPAATLAKAAFHVPLFHPKARMDETSGIALQLFQPVDAPFVGSDPQVIDGRLQYVQDRMVVFRVVEAHEAEPPKSLDEVRDAVERDLRIKKAFDKAEPVARELYAAARRVGLEKALELMPDLKTGGNPIQVMTPMPFARRTRSTDPGIQKKIEQGESPLDAPNVPGVGVSRPFVDACFEMTAPGWSPPEMDLPTTERVQAASTQPAAEPAPIVRLISRPELKRHFVVELAGTEPVDQERFDSELRQVSYYRLMSDRASIMRSKWCDPEEIRRRCGFVEIAGPGGPGAFEGIDIPRPLPPTF